MPTKKYKSEFCDQVVKLMKKGKSITQCCAALDINRDTFYEWQKTIPEFSEAAKQGRVYSEAWHIDKLDEFIEGTKKERTGLTALIYKLSNRFSDEWGTKHAVDEINQSIEKLSDKQQLEKLNQELQMFVNLTKLKNEPTI